MDFEPTGSLLGDLQLCIDNLTMCAFTYTDKKGDTSDRKVAPFEIRGNGLFGWSVEKNGSADSGLRFFLLGGISSFQVVDETFNKDDYKS